MSERPRQPAPPRQPPTERLNQPGRPYQPAAPVERSVYEQVPPEGPPRPWWESPGPAIATGIVALLLGGGVGYLIGHNAEERRGTHTVTNTTTVVHPKTVTHTNTVTAKTERETPSPANPANEARLHEAESNLRKLEKENREIRRSLAEAGQSP
jgi:hypothetical protein